MGNGAWLEEMGGKFAKVSSFPLSFSASLSVCLSPHWAVQYVPASSSPEGAAIHDFGQHQKHESYLFKMSPIS